MSGRVLLRVFCGAMVLASLSVSHAETNGVAAVAITTSWAQQLRVARELADVAKAAGAPGRTEATESRGSTTRTLVSWAGRDGKGHVRVFAYRSGGFAAIVTPADAPGEIVLNSFGAFVCAGCSPPVNACGRRPSWVPHDLHWDTFDCPHTITGPQDMPAGNGS